MMSLLLLETPPSSQRVGYWELPVAREETQRLEMVRRVQGSPSELMTRYGEVWVVVGVMLLLIELQNLD